MTDTSHSINKLYWLLYRNTSSALQISRDDEVFKVTLYWLSLLWAIRDKRGGTMSTHYHPQAETHRLSRKEETSDTCFCLSWQSTLSALYELNPATWIQCHSNFNPSVLKKIHVLLCFRLITQRLRIQDTCHSSSRQLTASSQSSALKAFISYSISKAHSCCLLWNNTIYLPVSFT